MKITRLEILRVPPSWVWLKIHFGLGDRIEAAGRVEVNDWREGGRTYIGRGYFAEPFALNGEGCVAVPQWPGLGVELDEAGMAAIMAKPWRVERG